MTDSKPAVDLNFAKWLQEFVDWLEEKFKTETEKRSQVYLDATEPILKHTGCSVEQR